MTSNVISFAAFKNDRRAAAETAKREEAKAARIEKERQEIADSLGGTAGAHIIADVLTDLKAKEQETKYVPAYCDPSNEVRGAKYEATRNLDITEIAKRMRADIKALNLRPGFKVAVRTQRYSGGQSIDIRVTALPDDFRVYSEARASWDKQFPNSYRPPLSVADQHSPEYNEVKAKLEAIHNAYNRDNSDSMTDYFDTRYYGSVNFEGTWERGKAEVEASPGTYWHPDSAR